MDPGLDTGPILSQRATAITSQDTAESLGNRLAQLGAELLIETLPAYIKRLRSTQNHKMTAWRPMLPCWKKRLGAWTFQQPAEFLARKVRAFNPWPGAFMIWQGTYLKIHQAHVHTQPNLRLWSQE